MCTFMMPSLNKYVCVGIDELLILLSSHGKSIQSYNVFHKFKFIFENILT